MGTTILISPETRDTLAKLREYPRETYDDVINKLISVYMKVKESKGEGKLKDEILKSIDEGREAYRKGECISFKELLQELESE